MFRRINGPRAFILVLLAVAVLPVTAAMIVGAGAFALRPRTPWPIALDD